MGTWGTAIKDSDAFADIYDEFFDFYNKGWQPQRIAQRIIEANWEMLEIEEEKHSLWFGLALAQWETKSLDPEVLGRVEDIVLCGSDLKIWSERGASKQDIRKRQLALDKFLEKVRSERPKAKPRKRAKVKAPVFSTGDCLAFKLRNGNYGGAVVLATDPDPESAYNLVATTRLNQSSKPSLADFEEAEVLVCNFGELADRPDVKWYAPDLYYKDYSHIYELVGRTSVEQTYETQNYAGRGYLFQPSWTAGWSINEKRNT